MNINFTVSTTQPLGVDWRMMIVYDREGDSVVPAISELLVTNSVVSQPVWSNRNRFDIIYDRTFTTQGLYFNTVAGGTYGWTDPPIHLNIPLNGRMTQYDNTSASQSSISQGGLYLVLLSNAGGNPDFVYSSRVIASK